MTLSGATTPGQSGLGSNGNEGVLCVPQSSIITGTSPLDCLVSYPGHSLGGLPFCRCAVSVFYCPNRLGKIQWFQVFQYNTNNIVSSNYFFLIKVICLRRLTTRCSLNSYQDTPFSCVCGEGDRRIQSAYSKPSSRKIMFTNVKTKRNFKIGNLFSAKYSKYQLKTRLVRKRMRLFLNEYSHTGTFISLVKEF